MTPEENKKANTLCLISFACAAWPILYLALGLAFGFGGDSLLGQVAAYLRGLSLLAALVLMIYVRVKYPQNKAGKRLMIAYIIVAVLAFAAFAFVVISCALACSGAWPDFKSFCESCHRL